jgi:uncharacterized protein YkwD
MLAKIVSRPKIAVLVMAAVIGVGATACIPDTGPPPQNDPYQTPLYNAINADRANNGIGPVAFSPKLSILAGGHSCDMAHANALFHDDLGGLMANGYGEFSALGENVIEAYPGTSAGALEQMWMGSPEHRANILNPGFNVVGINVCIGAYGTIWGTEDFGRL